jgi:hypothetical protein
MKFEIEGQSGWQIARRPEAVPKHAMQKPQGKRRRRETDQPRVEAAQRPKPWVSIEKI